MTIETKYGFSTNINFIKSNLTAIDDEGNKKILRGNTIVASKEGTDDVLIYEVNIDELEKKHGI